MALIKISNISKKYTIDRYAIQDVSFSVEGGEIVGLIGPNGAGKSTTLSILTGLIYPSTGSVVICNSDLGQHPKLAKSALGYAPDNTDLVQDLTLFEYVQLSISLYNAYRAPTLEYACHLIDFFGMSAYKHHLLRTYSHGMLKKAQIIACLAHKPKVVIFDEPTSGLDIESQVLFKMLCRRLSDANVAILIATHQMALANELCDKICMLKLGRVIAWDNTKNLLQTHAVQTLEDVFIKLAFDTQKTAADLEKINHHLSL